MNHGSSDSIRKHGIIDSHRDLDRLESALSDLFKRTNGQTVAPVGGASKILSLGCGESRETRLLRRVAAQASPTPVDSVSFIGVDVRWREIQEARANFGSPVDKFLVGDASRLSKIIPQESDFSLVFLRHQNVWHQPNLWRHIFEGGLEKLSKDGLLVITSYFTREHEMAIQAIKEAGGTLVADYQHTESRELYYPGKSVDRHLAAFRVGPSLPDSWEKSPMEVGKIIV
jgi:SAM-dependent methyltransferase